jgi:hypothetical protein
MQKTAAREIANAVRQFGRAKGDPFEAMLASGLTARGVEESRAQSAARECSNAIWRNGMVSGAAGVLLVSATHANLPAMMAGASMGTLGMAYTLALSDACRDVRELSDNEVFRAIDSLLGRH